VTIPTPADVIAYLGDQNAWEEAQVTAALDTELAQAANRLTLPETDEDWPDDLREAMFRRVARNLATRGLPLGIQPGVDGNAIRIGAWNAEAERLEAPFRKVVIG
jgi:hypothetical protein